MIYDAFGEMLPLTDEPSRIDNLTAITKCNCSHGDGLTCTICVYTASQK